MREREVSSEMPPISLSPEVRTALEHYANTLGKANVSSPDIDKALRIVAGDPRNMAHFMKIIDAVVNPPPNGSFLPPNFLPKE